MNRRYRVRTCDVANAVIIASKGLWRRRKEDSVAVDVIDVGAARDISLAMRRIDAMSRRAVAVADGSLRGRRTYVGGPGWAISR